MGIPLCFNSSKVDFLAFNEIQLYLDESPVDNLSYNASGSMALSADISNCLNGDVYDSCMTSMYDNSSFISILAPNYQLFNKGVVKYNNDTSNVGNTINSTVIEVYWKGHLLAAESFRAIEA